MLTILKYHLSGSYFLLELLILLCFEANVFCIFLLHGLFCVQDNASVANSKYASYILLHAEVIIS